MNLYAGENSTTQRLARAKVEDFNDAMAEAFAERMIRTLNGAVTTLLISVGHRTRLFDVMARIDPATRDEIARAVRLDARYVGEWLDAMTACGIVEYYGAKRTYYLPSEHAASLTRAAAPVNIASTMQFIPMLGSVEDEVIECFSKGGQIQYKNHSRFEEVMAGERDASVAPSLVDSILPLFPGLAEAISSPGSSAVSSEEGSGVPR